MEEFKEVYGIIYLIKNKVNNKIYIGQTIEKGGFDRRYRNNLLKNTHNEHLKNSILKYGIENFCIDKLFDIAYSQQELNKLEDMYIKVYRTTNSKYGYNKKLGGNNGKLSEETKKKLSLKLKGKFMGKNNPMFGKSVINHMSEEAIIKWKKNLSKSLTGRIISKETKEKMKKNNWLNNGGKFSEETKQKISNSKIGKYKGSLNPNYNNHRLSGKNHFNFGKHLSKTTKEKIGNSNKGKIPWNKGLKIPEMSGENNPNYNNKWNDKQKLKASEFWIEYWKNNKPNRMSKIINLDTLEVFETLKSAKEKYKNGDISACIRGKTKTAGGNYWMYYDDYIKLHDLDTNNYI